MKRKINTYCLNAVYFIYSDNCVTAFKESFNGSLTKVLREARQKAKTLKCDNWYIMTMYTNNISYFNNKERK